MKANNKSTTARAMTDQIIFVSGAAGLLGQRFVEIALDAGASVVAADINGQALDKLKKQLNDDYSLHDDSEFAAKLLTLQLDLTSPKDIQNALIESIDQFGTVTALVNAAYPRNDQYGREFFDVEYDDFCENLNLNIGTTFSISKVFAKYFQEQQQGNIINLGSIYGVMAPDFAIYPGSMTMPVEYAAIKSAVIHLTKYMAQLLRKDGVRVNCISPGGILDGQPESFLQRYRDKCGTQGMLNSAHLDTTLFCLLYTSPSPRDRG